MSWSVGAMAVLLTLLIAEQPGFRRDVSANPEAEAREAPAHGLVLAKATLIEETIVDHGWRNVRRPLPIYSLEAPDLSRESLRYDVALNDSEGRRDSLIWESDKPGSPLVHLSIERFGKAMPDAAPLFADLARRAAPYGASIERLAVPLPQPSKFGEMEAADMQLAMASNQMRACLAFRRVDAIGIVLAGWYCGTAERPVDRVSLTCWLDRLDLISAGSDQALKRFFAAAERARGACPNVRQPGRKHSWLDANAPVPALKTAISAKPKR